MKNQSTKFIAFTVISSALLVSCGGIGKMAKNAETVKYEVSPNPLIVRGDSVELNINGSFPAKYFYKKASVDLTPTLMYGGNATPFKVASFQGEDAVGNATIIPYEAGKTFTYTDKIAYTPAMEKSELMLKTLAKKGKKEKEFEAYKLADGVITTPYLMMSDDKVLSIKDNFQRITQHTQYAVMNYLVNSSSVRDSEFKKDDLKAMKVFIKDNGKKESISIKGLNVEAYASPEGEISKNENLAQERAESAAKFVTSEMKKNKMDAPDGFSNLVPKGEDWLGFKEKMMQSSVADKELILRILEMYTDLNKREEEIRNLAATYVELKDKILPELRRSQMTLNYEIVGKTDEVLKMMSKSSPDSLNAEELFFASTLTSDLNEKLAIYKNAERLFPTDERGSNNVGYIYMMQNKLSDAEAQFQKSNGIKNNPQANNNLGVVARLKGDRTKAMQMYKSATGAGAEVSYNMGIINIQNGDYSSAINNMSSMKSFNVALAKVLNGDAESASKVLAESPEKDSAMGNYLKAIIAARMNDATAVQSALQAAYAADPSLKDKAAKDLEFRSFQEAIK
jgi:Flp pilus assembly protein TadD